MTAISTSVTKFRVVHNFVISKLTFWPTATCNQGITRIPWLMYPILGEQLHPCSSLATPLRVELRWFVLNWYWSNSMLYGMWKNVEGLRWFNHQQVYSCSTPYGYWWGTTLYIQSSNPIPCWTPWGYWGR